MGCEPFSRVCSVQSRRAFEVAGWGAHPHEQHHKPFFGPLN